MLYRQNVSAFDSLWFASASFPLGRSGEAYYFFVLFYFYNAKLSIIPQTEQLWIVFYLFMTVGFFLNTTKANILQY